MRITIIGYGKMGQTIERLAQEQGHEISHKIDFNNQESLKDLSPALTDVAIEFTQPESAFENLKTCIAQGIPIISGTTGWLDKKPELEAFCLDKGGAFFYASNFSIGVNLFFKLNQFLAQLMKNQAQYRVQMEEIHHTQKKDAPSGTAITLGNDIIQTQDSLKKWVNQTSDSNEQLGIISKRIDKVPGTHSIAYNSNIDQIEIKHTAHSREGFALGAIRAAEWIIGKKGVFGMDDMLQLNPIL